MKRTSLVVAAAVVSGAAVSSALAAGPVAVVVRPPNPGATTAVVRFTVTCIPPTSQVCSPMFRQPVQVARGWRVSGLRYTASKLHCSAVRVRFVVNGTPRRLSVPLQPRQSHTVVASLGRGTHLIQIRGVGVTGGCNTGVTGSWGGALTVFYSRVV